MKLRNYQNDAVNSIFGYFDNYTGNPVVAMPTGTGKSLVIADFIRRALHMFPNTRLQVLTHVKELITQNVGKLEALWPHAPIGVYSAGLGIKESNMPITFGGIASVIKIAESFGHIDLLLIDECHLLNPNADTMYATYIAILKAKNPFLKVIGFSATPWRMGQGLITDGGVFTDICMDQTGIQAFNWFIQEGYLIKLIPRPTSVVIDLTGVGTSNGDYTPGQLQKASDQHHITKAALQEVCYYGANRKKWLIFCAGLEHAEHTADMLNAWGIPTCVIHSRVPNRDQIIRDYRAGKYRAAVTNNMLTTGYDDPTIDLIAMLRATMSPGLWVQMLGRGTRPAFRPSAPIETAEQRWNEIRLSGKLDCLVLDFAQNILRLGPINDPVIPVKKGGGGGEAPVKICRTQNLKAGWEGCGCYNHSSVRVCDNCGAEFDFSVKISNQSGVGELIATDAPVMEWFSVNNISYERHTGPSGIPCLQVTYWCGKKGFKEFVFLEHGANHLGHEARNWWRSRIKPLLGVDTKVVPATVKDALPYCNKTFLKQPVKIQVWTNRQYPQIQHYEYE